MIAVFCTGRLAWRGAGSARQFKGDARHGGRENSEAILIDRDLPGNGSDVTRDALEGLERLTTKRDALPRVERDAFHVCI
ncbi:hypothetical protein HMH01_08215 [Halovulum dunhuangense]|uniref:Uncharacterized protein n=1 Tax=Halovulum dunhuangense TaxID=1505036 RepID=A0A849L2F5_9RHOB|nr:hypothetical protein [Halovulum dunhuangense]NNU80424.1 hypothetical protein [Halovulum dunhuangense]